MITRAVWMRDCFDDAIPKARRLAMQTVGYSVLFRTWASRLKPGILSGLPIIKRKCPAIGRAFLFERL
jgi:hypothetical protein